MTNDQDGQWATKEDEWISASTHATLDFPWTGETVFYRQPKQETEVVVQEDVGWPQGDEIQ